MRGQVVAVLLDSAPRTWRSTEELLFQFSRALIARGARVCLVFSEDPPCDIRERYQVQGVDILPAMNYEGTLFKFYWQLGQMIKRNSVTAVHLMFFNYFSLIPWMASLWGVRYIVHHERNSGTLQARYLKKGLLRLRTRITTLPLTRVVAISEYIKQQLVEAGLQQQKITVVHNGIDIRRFFQIEAHARVLVASSRSGRTKSS